MGDKSTIEWTDATWNPVRGCAIVSKGCTNCYAMRQAHRSSGPGGAYEGLTKLTKGGPVWTGAIRLVPHLLDQPLRWRRPRRIFVNSMSDLFHETVDVVFIASVLGIASACPQHKFQVLTKRPARMLEILQSADFLRVYESSQAMYTNTEIEWPAPNVWLGVSVEDQASADERIPLLLQAPAAVRWISAEPLLGPINIGASVRTLASISAGVATGVGLAVWKVGLEGFHRATPIQEALPQAAYPSASKGIDWVVAGGESGPGARPMCPDWARTLRDQCALAGVPFFFKQWGSWLPAGQDGNPDHHPLIINAGDHALHTTKKAAGRQLDGRTHDEYPIQRPGRVA